jgi:hypothetical protein
LKKQDDYIILTVQALEQVRMFEYFEPPPEFLSRQRFQIFLTIVWLKKMRADSSQTIQHSD